MFDTLEEFTHPRQREGRGWLAVQASQLGEGSGVWTLPTSNRLHDDRTVTLPFAWEGEIMLVN